MAKINEEALLKPIRAQVDRIMIVTLGFLLVVSIGIGWFYSALLMSLLIAVPAFVVPFFIWKTAAGSFLLRISIATALVFNVAIHIQASHGLIEMHFGVFAVLAFLLAYRDWKVIVYAAALVAVHHIVLNFLQAADFDVWVFRNGADFGIVIVHALFVVFESAILVLLAVQLRKELVRLAMVAEIAERISEGDLSSKIDVDDSDFVAVLLKSMQRIQHSLNSFVVAQENLAQQHIDGFISERIDSKKLVGVYGEIAVRINELVASHIAVKMQVIDVISHYAKGDFSVDMERLPNEKAKISLTIDGVKNTLLSVSNEVNLLVKAGASGDFTHRGNANQFEYTFKDMILSLNSLLETCDNGFKDIERVANALAKGDLTQTIDKHYVGTFGKVTGEMNSTVENLKSLINEIQESAETISAATREIAAGNNDLSHRTEEQGSNLEKTAASMTQLTSTVQSNADNAKHGNQLAIGATDIAGKGLAVVNSVVTTMADINTSSLRIVDIISVIDDIAFQTNILALNAAVEAARAGEQGKGFAVVAIEVRNLAQRAANAAGEIKRLIDDSVSKVNDGGKLVATAGETMTEIVTSIQSVTKIMAEISNASAEQSAGIGQVNKTIMQLDNTTQQNAALVEEAASASEALEQQAQHLAQSVHGFKTQKF
jgi:methyl-accepting chemotaxis protein